MNEFPSRGGKVLGGILCTVVAALVVAYLITDTHATNSWVLAGRQSLLGW